VGDIPLDHLLYYVAFVFFTMALLGDGELRRIRPDGKLHPHGQGDIQKKRQKTPRVETAAVDPKISTGARPGT